VGANAPKGKIDVFIIYQVYFKIRKMHKLWSIDSQEN